jgi:hypothetical protein
LLKHIHRRKTNRTPNQVLQFKPLKQKDHEYIQNRWEDRVHLQGLLISKKLSPA